MSRFAIVAVALLAGCSLINSYEELPHGADGGAASTTSTGGAGGHDTSSAGATGGSDPSGGSGGSAGMSGTGGMACIPENAVTALRPLDMMLIVDHSASMVGTWPTLRSEIATFTQAARPVGTSVALDMNPDGPLCTQLDYYPADLGYQEIPAAGAVIEQVLVTWGAEIGQSPINPALEGSLHTASDRAIAFPMHVGITVLMMDSTPNNCDVTPALTTQLVLAAYGTHKIATFAIELSTDPDLDYVALAGGTVSAIQNIDSNGVSTSLEMIRSQSIPCELPLPATPQGIVFDPDRVNLIYTESMSSQPVTIPRIADGSACGTSHAWYWDLPSAPTKLLLCPTLTCTSIKSDMAPVLEVAFGCPTETG